MGAYLINRLDNYTVYRINGTTYHISTVPILDIKMIKYHFKELFRTDIDIVVPKLSILPIWYAQC